MQIHETKDQFVITVPRIKPQPSASGKSMHHVPAGRQAVATDSGTLVHVNLSVTTPKAG